MLERKNMFKVPWLLRLLSACIALLILGYYFALNRVNSADSLPFWSTDHAADHPHPIIQLVRNAEETFNELISRETHGLGAAASAYREKRGRHPPPGFKEWYIYAQENNAIFVEEFWDQIYHDLTPLWALNQKQMREHVRAHNEIITIRQGNVTSNSDFFWVEIWKELVSTIADYLPDLEMAMNMMDEPRLLVPWEQMRSYVEMERNDRKILPVGEVKSRFSGMPTTHLSYISMAVLTISLEANKVQVSHSSIPMSFTMKRSSGTTNRLSSSVFGIAVPPTASPSEPCCKQIFQLLPYSHLSSCRRIYIRASFLITHSPCPFATSRICKACMDTLLSPSASRHRVSSSLFSVEAS
jgi:hypothetical protein